LLAEESREFDVQINHRQTQTYTHSRTPGAPTLTTGYQPLAAAAAAVVQARSAHPKLT